MKALRFAPVAVILALAGCSDGVDRDAYVEKNEAIRRSLPVFPGARQVNVEHSAGRSGPDGGGPVTSYGTIVTYKVPPDTRPRAVFDFYAERLTGWRVVRRADGFSPTDLQTTEWARGNASVAVNPDNVREQVRTYVVVIDHDRYS